MIYFVIDFINNTFNQEGIDSKIFKIKFSTPPNRIFQHLPVKESVKTIKVNRKRNERLYH